MCGCLCEWLRRPGVHGRLQLVCGCFVLWFGYNPLCAVHSVASIVTWHCVTSCGTALPACSVCACVLNSGCWCASSHLGWPSTTIIVWGHREGREGCCLLCGSGCVCVRVAAQGLCLGSTGQRPCVIDSVCHRASRGSWQFCGNRRTDTTGAGAVVDDKIAEAATVPSGTGVKCAVRVQYSRAIQAPGPCKPYWMHSTHVTEHPISQDCWPSRWSDLSKANYRKQLPCAKQAWLPASFHAAKIIKTD